MTLFCDRNVSDAVGGLAFVPHRPPSTNGRRRSPCSKPTRTSSSICGIIISPAFEPPPGVTTRAHQLSSWSLRAGNLTRTRPMPSGSLLLVTMPIVRPVCPNPPTRSAPPPSRSTIEAESGAPVVNVVVRSTLRPKWCSTDVT